MLNIMREHVQSYLIKFILFVVIGSFLGTIFLVWGMGGEKSDTVIVAHVYQEPIYEEEYRQTLQNIISFYRRIYKDNFNDETIAKHQLKKRAIDELIRKRILLKEADLLGMEVSKHDLAARIMSIPSFQIRGAFSSERYKRTLKMNHLTPSEFESGIKESIILERIENMVKDRVKVSEKEIRENYFFDNDKIIAEYVAFPPELFKDKVSIKDEDVKTWFEENKENYRTSEKRIVSSIIIDPEKFHDKIQPVTDQEIEEYYQFNEQNYHKEPQVEASHILIKVPSDAKAEEEETAKKKIEDLRSQIMAGGNFSELAEEHSEDDATNKKGGNLGFFSKGRMVPAFEEAAFNLEPGEISEPIRSPYGFHLIKTTAKKEGGIPPLDELKGEIEKIITGEKEQEIAEDLADRIYSELSETQDLEAVATKYSLRVRNFPPRSIKEIRDRKEAEDIFSLKPGQITGIIRSGNKMKIARLDNIEAPEIPEFAKVEGKVKEDLKNKKASEMAEEEANAALKKLRDGSLSFEKLAETYKIEVKNTKEINRRGYIPNLGKLDDPIYPLFELKTKEYSGLFHKGDQKIIFQIKEVKKADQKKFEESRSRIARNLMNSKKDVFFNAWLNQRRKLAEIQLNPKQLN